MDQKRFHEVLQKYIQGRATPEEKAMIDAWYERMGMDNSASLGREEDAALEDQYWAAIKNEIDKRAGRSRTVLSWKSFKIAASLIFAMAASFSIWSGSESAMVTHVPASFEIAELPWERIFNAGQSARRVPLPDGSIVTLEPKSEVRFLVEFNGTERSVWLEGEAFFNVCPDKEKPFLVHTRQLMTKVLGTSFRIRAFKNDDNVTVAVKTGKVFVTTEEKNTNDADKGEVILTPNQKVVYNKVQRKLARTIVEKPEIILPEEEVRLMRFESAPVSEIFNAIEKVYGVDLVFDPTKFESCKLTSVISDGELYNRLDIICKAIGASYELQENYVVISGGVCHTE